MTTKQPLVSVIVPSFNQGRFIRETIDSILDQDYRPLEILVVDGASTDSTVEVLKSYGNRPELKWWSEPDQGVTDAVNKGLQRAKGEVIAIQSSDDVYLPGAIRAAVEALNRQEDIALVYGDVEYIDEHSRLMGQDILSPFDLKRYLGRFTYIPQPSAFFRASVAHKVGGWRRQVSYVADADYWLRIATVHKAQKIDRMMARYRYHPSQRDTQQAKIARDWEQAIQDLIASVPLTGGSKRNALMGIQLAKYRYTPEWNWVRRTQHLYKAALANPRGVFDPAFPKRELLVGRRPIWKSLSRIKRRLGFSPRQTNIRTYSARQKLGALIYDFPRYAKLLWLTKDKSGTSPWVFIRNRNERLIAHDSQTSARCDWKWTSDLHLAKVFPAMGKLLMKRALQDWPIALQAEPTRSNTNLQLSFVIGHRGLERLPHLLLTLQSIAAQREVSFECIVVEQSAVSELKGHLPSWVRYIHTPLPYADMPYSRSWAFNVGVGGAKARTVILHDNDMLVPMDYGKQVIARIADGYDAMNLKRFVFYLGQAHSAAVFAGKESLEQQPPQEVVQNLEAGGSFAITREAYFSIGGFDEEFLGWGGEDNEFWERAQTRKVWPYAYLPLVHLWHQSQPEKVSRQHKTVELFEQRSSLPVEMRIAELTARMFKQTTV